MGQILQFVARLSILEPCQVTSRDLVYAAIEHRETPRVPYSILTTGATNAQIRDELGVEDDEAWLDNDIQSVGVPWWGRDGLKAHWRGAATPTSPATGVREPTPMRE